MIFITADPHGDYQYIEDFCIANNTSPMDLLFVLGDVELNIENNDESNRRKKLLASLPITFVCIHGNHEKRPSDRDGYEYALRYGSIMMYERNYPNIYFALDGETYSVQGKSFLVVGGACSPNRYFNASTSEIYNDEQPSLQSFEKIRHRYQKENNVDIILTHTCPYNFVPYDACSLPIDQSRVDRTTEKRLQWVYEHLEFSHWYCGHYHTNRTVENITFVYKRIINL